MEIAALASGSSGNCFYVGEKDSAVLIDVGISAKQAVQRLIDIGGNPENIKGIFVTHEHIDHIKGVDVLARKLNIPIFITKATAENGFICSDEKLINYIQKNDEVEVGGLKIEAFSKSHGAADPISYSVYGSKKVSVITDAGYTCENIQSHVSDCHFLFIEANHDEEMLKNGPYPFHLKKLIGSDKGHLSNKQAASCLAQHASKKLKKVVLAHLSKTNNTPEIALKTFEEFLGSKKDFSADISVSVRERPTELFKI